MHLLFVDIAIDELHLARYLVFHCVLVLLLVVLHLLKRLFHLLVQIEVEVLLHSRLRLVWLFILGILHLLGDLLQLLRDGLLEICILR